MAAVLATAVLAQDSAEELAPDAAAQPPESVETITVRGQRIGKLLGILRMRVEMAEEAVFARWNEINSTDDFDIHCSAETRYGSRATERVCQSNSWKEQQGKIGTEQARAIQGRGSPGLAELHAQEQLRKQRQLEAEMRRVADEDEQLADAIAALTRAQTDVVVVQGNRTLLRDVSAVSAETHGAERVLEIVMGFDPFRHRLTQKTFTLAHVFGEIRKLDVECAEGHQRFEYTIGVEWSVPSDWSACVLRVSAKKGTTFKLYEFSGAG